GKRPDRLLVLCPLGFTSPRGFSSALRCSRSSDGRVERDEEVQGELARSAGGGGASGLEGPARVEEPAGAAGDHPLERKGVGPGGASGDDPGELDPKLVAAFERDEFGRAIGDVQRPGCGGAGGRPEGRAKEHVAKRPGGAVAAERRVAPRCPTVKSV